MVVASARPASSFTMADAIVIPPSQPGFARVEVRALPHRYRRPGAGTQRLEGGVGNDRRGVAVPGTRPGGGARDGRVDPLLELKVECADETLPPVGRHPAAERALPLQYHRVAFGERRDAGLAHDLAPDVVAIGYVYRYLDVHQGPAGHLKKDEDRILQLPASAAAARRQDRRGDDLFLEQPADDVDIVDRRVVDRHVAGVG